MKKKLKKISAALALMTILASCHVAYGSTISRYGNKSSYLHHLAWTQSKGSWAKVVMYSRDSRGNDSSFGSAYAPQKSYGAAWAQTPSIYSGLLFTAVYSTHSCSSYTVRKSF